MRLDILGKFGICCAQLGQREKATNSLKKAVELAESLVDARSDDPTKQEQLAMVYNTYANLMFGAHRNDVAMTYYKKSTEIREKIDPAKLPGVTLRLGELLRTRD